VVLCPRGSTSGTAVMRHKGRSRDNLPRESRVHRVVGARSLQKDAPTERTFAAHATTMLAGGYLRILVIDRDESLCRRFQQALQPRSVAWCTSGSHGLERAMEEPFDLIVTDAQLDDGSGLALPERLTESLPETPLVTLSAMSADRHVLRTGSSSGNIKLIEYQQLLALMQREAATHSRTRSEGSSARLRELPLQSVSKSRSLATVHELLPRGVPS
jgi:DNA-binding NtrC family response regulator